MNGSSPRLLCSSFIRSEINTVTTPLNIIVTTAGYRVSDTLELNVLAPSRSLPFLQEGNPETAYAKFRLLALLSLQIYFEIPQTTQIIVIDQNSSAFDSRVVTWWQLQFRYSTLRSYLWSRQALQLDLAPPLVSSIVYDDRSWIDRSTMTCSSLLWYRHNDLNPLYSASMS